MEWRRSWPVLCRVREIFNQIKGWTIWWALATHIPQLQVVKICSYTLIVNFLQRRSISIPFYWPNHPVMQIRYVCPFQYWTSFNETSRVCELSYRYFIRFENLETEWKQMLEDSGITENLELGMENSSGLKGLKYFC